MIRRVGEPGFYPVVVFDLDGTLLRGTTVSLLLAQWLGQTEEIAELERASTLTISVMFWRSFCRRATIERPSEHQYGLSSVIAAYAA
jgi:phosphoserine phosphatase